MKRWLSRRSPLEELSGYPALSQTVNHILLIAGHFSLQPAWFSPRSILALAADCRRSSAETRHQDISSNKLSTAPLWRDGLLEHAKEPGSFYAAR